MSTSSEYAGLSSLISSRFLPVNDLNVHFLEAQPSAVPTDGSKPPLLILLHGFPELAYSWRKVIVPLSEAGFYVVAPDSRGYGLTKRKGVQFKYDRFSFEDDLAPFRGLNLAADVVYLVYALGYTSVAAVIGHDFGSSVAGHCALIRPDMFKSVVLMSAPYTSPPPISSSSSPISAIIRDLAALDSPRKHYIAYYSTREADTDMCNPPQGLQAFLRAYYHVKSGDSHKNAPYRLPSLTALSLAQLPLYYVMNLSETMPETVERDMPSGATITNNSWLTETEMSVYSTVYRETGFQGGLNRYRCVLDAQSAADMRVLSGKKIEVPAMFLSGDRDWGVYQLPGAVEVMQKETCTQMREEDFVLIKGAGHWVQQEAAEAVVEHLLRFLRQQEV
ncbi:hypothetical protein H0H92_008283 [Tricholoma furcatifolium]|nr:hypothetical protein H0H92_008283 [Tricholoma furcatifolium]